MVVNHSWLPTFILFSFLPAVIANYEIRAVKSTNGSLFLLTDFQVHFKKICRYIPDEVTLKELDFNVTKLGTISDSDLLAYEVGPPVPSLIMPAYNPDELMRVLVHRAETLNPLKFKTLARQYGMYNPCMVEWQGRVLMTWAMPSNYKGDPLKRDEPNQGDLRFAWLEKGSYNVLSKDTLFGIGPDFRIQHEPRDRFLEDPRLQVLSNNSLLLTYAAVDMYEMKFYFHKMIFDIKNGTVVTSGLRVAEGEKNWVPFEHDKKVLYFRHMNPLRIVEIVSLSNGTEVVKDVVQGAKVELPWRQHAFHDGIRGSTPALLVRGVYLAFFHTKTQLMPHQRRCSYFMGAIAFCPNHPFEVHSMSNYPILHPSWYEGQWMAKDYEHIMYPTGMVFPPDGQTLILSLGYQNKDLVVLSLDIEELFESLVLVKECSNTTTGRS